MNVSQVSMLHEYLERNSAKHPDKLALIFKNQRLTWRQIDEMATRLANSLRELGVKRGDRVVTFLDNSVELCVAIWGILRCDAIFVVINSQTKVDKLTYMINDCRPRAVIVDQTLEALYKEVLPHTPPVQHALVVMGNDTATPATDTMAHVRLHSYERSLSQASPSYRGTKNIPIDLAAIIYTSGSTGDPKGVMLTHHNMVSATESITTYLRNQPDDVVMNFLPLSFDYGLYQWINVNQFGGTLVLETSFNYPSAILNLIEKEKVTGFPVVPTTVSILTQFVAKGLELKNVRYTTNTAAALSHTHIDTLKKLCPSARLFSMYGLTECKRVSYLPPEEIDKRPDSVGRAMPNMETFIADDDGKRLPPNTIGELVVRGPHVMKGYWEKPQQTAERLYQGDIPTEMYLRTGDQFKMDEDGFLYFVGRRDDIIKSRGEKVSPKEVENVLYSMPCVQDAAVVGMPDDILGQAVHAYIVLRDGMKASSAEIIRFCQQRLEPFMVPKQVTFIVAMPKTTSNKISKKDLGSAQKVQA